MAAMQEDIRLIYEGVDITEEARVEECVVKDVSGCEKDCLNILMQRANNWYEWKPQKNDRIKVTRSGYDTQTMYLTAIAPEGNAYRIYATGAKCADNPARWNTFENMTLAGIMNLMAAESGMKAELWGINGSVAYEYLLRDLETNTAFMQRLISLEGGILKAMGGKFAAIGIEYAQRNKAMQTRKMEGDSLSVRYTDRRDGKWGGGEIVTPYGHGIARDTAAEGRMHTVTDICVNGNAEANRWAKGMLIEHNRQAETVDIDMEFNPGLTAMARVDIESRTEMEGSWIVDRATHDLMGGWTKARLLRCVNTIA